MLIVVYKKLPIIKKFYKTKFFCGLQADLDNTVGLAADIGASGIIVWGNRFDENTSPEVCHKIDNYIATKLGPYLQNKQRQVFILNLFISLRYF